LPNEGPGVRELLDTVVARVGDVDVSSPIHGDATGVVQLPVPGTPAAPLGEEGPGVRELLDAVVYRVEVGVVGYEDVPFPIHGDDRDAAHAELPVPPAHAARLC